MLIYQVIIFILAAFAIFRGFKRGFARQTPAVVGMAFGIICCRIFMVPMMEIIREAMPMRVGHPEEGIFYGTLACAVIFILVYELFSLILSFVGKLLANGEHTIIDKIGGAFFTLFRYLLLLSICYSMILAYSPRSALLKAGQSDDGNAAEMVLLLGSAVLGYESVETLAHKIQIEDAHLISCQSGVDVKINPYNLHNSQLRCNFA